MWLILSNDILKTSHTAREREIVATSVLIVIIMPLPSIRILRTSVPYT